MWRPLTFLPVTLSVMTPQHSTNHYTVTMCQKPTGNFFNINIPHYFCCLILRHTCSCFSLLHALLLLCLTIQLLNKNNFHLSGYGLYLTGFLGCLIHAFASCSHTFSRFLFRPDLFLAAAKPITSTKELPRGEDGRLLLLLLSSFSRVRLCATP